MSQEPHQPHERKPACDAGQPGQDAPGERPAPDQMPDPAITGGSQMPGLGKFIIGRAAPRDSAGDAAAAAPPCECGMCRKERMLDVAISTFRAQTEELHAWHRKKQRGFDRNWVRLRELRGQAMTALAIGQAALQEGKRWTMIGVTLTVVGILAWAYVVWLADSLLSGRG